MLPRLSMVIVDNANEVLIGSDANLDFSDGVMHVNSC